MSRLPSPWNLTRMFSGGQRVEFMPDGRALQSAVPLPSGDLKPPAVGAVQWPQADGGNDSETANAQILANLLDQPIVSPYGRSLSLVYDHLMGDVTQGSALARAGAEGDRVFEQTLRGQKLSVSGVNLDEEAVRLVTYQHAYQASARYIAIVRDLIEIMVSL